MTVLLCIGSLKCGGAERVTVALANYLVRKGHSVKLTTIRDSHEDFYTVEAGVVRACLVETKTQRPKHEISNYWRNVRSLRQTIRAEQPDIVIGMMTRSAILSILACVWLPTRVIVSERNFPARQPIGLGISLLRRILYRFADAHVVQTSEIADWVIRRTAARNVWIIPNSVKWPIPAYPPFKDPRAYITQGQRMIIAVGSKSEQKGFDLLLNAFASIAAKYPSWSLAILGLDSRTDRKTNAQNLLLEQANALGISERIHFPGHVGNVSDWYQRADLFVLSSRYEGFPNVLLEAMSAGCACVSFDCDTGPREIIEHGANGFLVEAENVTQLSEIMDYVMGDDEKRVHIGAMAKMVTNEYSEEAIFQRWCELFESIRIPRDVMSLP